MYTVAQIAVAILNVPKIANFQGNLIQAISMSHFIIGHADLEQITS